MRENPIKRVHVPFQGQDVPVMMFDKTNIFRFIVAMEKRMYPKDMLFQRPMG